MPKLEKIKRICTKESPFKPPKQENEWWEHVDAYTTESQEYDGDYPQFHCPNCGLDFTMDCR